MAHYVCLIANSDAICFIVRCTGQALAGARIAPGLRKYVIMERVHCSMRVPLAIKQ